MSLAQKHKVGSGPCFVMALFRTEMHPPARNAALTCPTLFETKNPTQSF